MIKLRINTAEVHCAMHKEHIQIQTQLIGGDVIKLDLGIATNKDGKLIEVIEPTINKIISAEGHYETPEEIEEYLDDYGYTEEEIGAEIKRQFLISKGFDKPENVTPEYTISEQFKNDPASALMNMLFGESPNPVMKIIPMGKGGMVN